MTASEIDNLSGEPDAAASNALPEYWPAGPTVEPVRAWWIPWPIAIVLLPLLWLMPKRMGPHFAAVRWLPLR